jgi:hypothetical protein
MNVYKKFDKAYAKVRSFPRSDMYDEELGSRRLFSSRVRAAYEALLEMVEKEQTFRLNALFKTRSLKYPYGIAGLSDTNLNALRAWTARVMDSADFILKEGGPGDRRAYESICYAADYLDKNLHHYQKPAGDSVVDRAYVSARAKLNGIAKKAARLKEIAIKPFREPTPVDNFKSWVGAFETAGSEVLLGGNENGAVSLFPDKQGFNGAKTPAPKWNCYVCRDASDKWVMGSRWGGEDYPCPRCNREEYLKQYPEEKNDPNPYDLETLVKEVEADLCELINTQDGKKNDIPIDCQ